MNTLNKIAVLMSAALFLTAIPAMAQINQTVKFDAPFAFYAGSVKLPAGSYTVTQSDDHLGILLLESADHSQSTFVECMTVDANTPSSDTEVSFNKYGNTDFLDRISLQGESAEMQILPSTAEQNAAQAVDAVEHSLSAKSGQSVKIGQSAKSGQ
ncbi:MAG: hypothetical protein JWN45_1286 [Acidobacteriaceae bacterium]|nr:hypothetical protein [Acidobacteriaceae bacterium]